jgi:uroporphyrinogen-III synthase
MLDAPCHLGGLSILVTRPAHQADQLCEMIEQAHGRPIRFPALEIRGTSDPESARAALGAPCDILVFVSSNAVDQGYGLLPDTLPGDLEIAAVGRATARRLGQIGLEPTLLPADRFDSEGLLELPQLNQVTGKRILIVRGNDGREKLAETLAARGAQVRYAEVYERVIPQRSARNLVQNWHHMVDVVTATSNAILNNLFTLLGESGSELLRAAPLIVCSARMAEHAVRRGCDQIHVAASAMDEDLLAALCEVSEVFR